MPKKEAKEACMVCKDTYYVDVQGGQVACPVCVPRPAPTYRKWYWPFKKRPLQQHEETRPTKVWNKIKDHTLWMRSPKKFLVEMTFSNGNIGYMVVRPKDHIWHYKGESYIIVEAASRWCGTAKKAMLRYAEGYCLPIEFSPDAVKERDKAGIKAPDIKSSFEPSVLREVLRFEYVKAMLRSMASGLMIVLLLMVGLNIILTGVLLYFSGKYGKWW